MLTWHEQALSYDNPLTLTTVEVNLALLNTVAINHLLLVIH